LETTQSQQAVFGLVNPAANLGRDKAFAFRRELFYLSCHLDEIEAAMNHDREEFRVYGEKGKFNFPDKWTPLPNPPERE